MTPNLSLHGAFIEEFPGEAARVLETCPPQEIAALLETNPAEEAARVFAFLTPVLAAEVLGEMSDPFVAELLARLSPSLAATLVQQLEPEAQEKTLAGLPEAARREISSFMEYPPEAVGRIMDPRVFSLPEDMPVEEAIEHLRTKAPRDLQTLYVVNRGQKLVGGVSLRELLLAPREGTLGSVMRPDPPAIQPMEPREEIVTLFNERNVLSIPVVDLDGILLGVIRPAGVMRATQEDTTAEMLKMVGVQPDERALSPVSFSVRKRLPWLQVNLLTAFLAAFVVGVFEDTIARITALAVLLPVVAGQSGNTGAQSLAVVMRGLAMRDVRPSQWMRVAGKEVTVGFVNGIAVSATTGIAVYFWSGSLALTGVIVAAMVFSMAIAGFAGAVIPVVLRALNQDPAQSSSIILTTVTDVVGFLSFLGLATIFAKFLV